MEILLLVGLGLLVGAAITIRGRKARRSMVARNYRQFYADGTMTQEIEALQLESSQHDQSS